MANKAQTSSSPNVCVGDLATLEILAILDPRQKRSGMTVREYVVLLCFFYQGKTTAFGALSRMVSNDIKLS